MTYSHLPHIDQKNHYQFITFRTHDSIDSFIKKLSIEDKSNSRKQFEIDDYCDKSKSGSYLINSVIEILYGYLKSKMMIYTN